MPREGGVSSTPRTLDSITNASGILDRPPQCAIAHKADDDTECASAFSRRSSPEVCIHDGAAQIQRAQGRPGARCTRGLACNCAQKTRTRAYRFSGSIPAFPAQWLYGLLRALPSERLSCHCHHADTSASLDASTAASGPHNFAVRISHPRQSWRPRPPQPVPTFVTMANAPLAGQDGDSLVLICPSGNAHAISALTHPLLAFPNERHLPKYA